ncbi:MAG TPA: BamA/TamA family outer membrane protein [Gemmatimonadaceae bacterium]|nr:BamA/TamA family outer membrane protein [Gemmatimonadaceae bacterium]
MGRQARLAPALALAMLWLPLSGTRAEAQDVRCEPGEPEVRRLIFTGNRALPDYVLERGIETTQSSWLRRTLRIGGQRYCVDSRLIERDSARLSTEFQARGFPGVRVTPRVTPAGEGAVAVEFLIEEGRPILVDSLVFDGLDSVPDRERVLRDLPIELRDRFDIYQVEATRDTITRRLRDNGYPIAEVLRSYNTYVDERRAELTYTAVTGPRARIGAITITVAPRPGERAEIDPDRVRRTLGLREGQLYRETSLENVKRGLYQTGAFRSVDISIDSTSLLADADSLVTIAVTLHESELRAARASLGWGNLDCLRAQFSHTNYNFLGTLRRLDLATRVSKVGIDPPFDVARGLCTSQLRNDPLSDTLNYYLSATLTQAALFGLRVIPSLTLYSERRSEYQAFIRDTPIGVVGAVQQGVDGQLPRTYSYQMEYGRTIAQPAFFCAVFNVCEDAAREQLEELTRSAALGYSITRTRANELVNPTNGSVVRLDWRHASPWVGSSPEIQFNRFTLDAALYRRAFSAGAFVVRLRGGAVLGSRLSFSGGPAFIPVEERLYAGGPNTVRGYQQNELGPAIYLPDAFSIDTIPGSGDTLAYFRANPDSTGERVVPTGGDNLIVANAELRLRSPILPEIVQWALFVDAGQVWNRGRAGTGVNFSDLRTTPGVGVRVFTAFGPIRVDVGYNPYQRPAGPAYFNPIGTGAEGETVRLICVSPGNTLRVRLADETRPPMPVDEGDCPATYSPARRATFLSRLTFQFSIGQPF